MPRIIITLLMVLAVSRGGERALVGVEHWARNLELAKRAVGRLNQYRAGAGLSKVKLDEALTVGAVNHARYLVLNDHASTPDKDTHSEEEGRPGYSRSGNSAATTGNVAAFWHRHNRDPLNAVSGWTNTLLHRFWMLHPELRRVGFGSFAARAWSAAVMNFDLLRPGNYKADRAYKLRVVAFPFDGQRDVPRAMDLEAPNPIPPSDRDQVVGSPITLSFYRGVAGVERGIDIPQNVSAELRLGGPRGKNVPFYLSVPKRPLVKAPSVAFVFVGILPEDTLKANSDYWVSISGKLDGKTAFKHQWTFRTGRRLYRLRPR